MQLILCAKAMDLLVVLKKDLATYNQQPTSQTVIYNCVAMNFGEDVRIYGYEKYYVIEFPNKTSALKALKVGLDVGHQVP